MSDLGFGVLCFVLGVGVTLGVEWVGILLVEMLRWKELGLEGGEDPFWDLGGLW